MILHGMEGEENGGTRGLAAQDEEEMQTGGSPTGTPDEGVGLRCPS